MEGNMSRFDKVLSSSMGAYGMKLGTLAKVLRVSEEEVRKWMMGTAFPEPVVCLRISDVFSLNYIDIQDAVDEDRERMLAAEAYEYLIKRVRQLTPAEAKEAYKKLVKEETA